MSESENRDYVYRVRWMANGEEHTMVMDYLAGARAEARCLKASCDPVVERALLGAWEKVER